MGQRIFCFFVCQLLFLGVRAQLALSGNVVSADTHLPVAAANVYLNNSTVGTITDEKGQFTLKRFPNGRFDLVVSCIGYETYHVTLQSNQLPEKISVPLKPAIQELQEVVVEAYDRNGWKKWGKLFMDNFMGTSANVRDCKLM
ncbi:MAG: carboxypeptidase-like regulatory domain-containing protein, partial [Bacteroidota bacterium]|nr:carboxypeptidase-like regulatory domain-containing protein [Bacteroidota bacterium]